MSMNRQSLRQHLRAKITERVSDLGRVALDKILNTYVDYVIAQKTLSALFRSFEWGSMYVHSTR